MQSARRRKGVESLVGLAALKGRNVRNILERYGPVSAEIMNRWNKSLATWSVRPVGLLYEWDLAGIYDELGW